jgi:hypothetical protein
MQRLNSSLFTWSRWRAGSIADFGIPCRKDFIIASKEVLKKYAVGYCKGESVPCRPKSDRIAVMFFYEGKHFWNHVLIEEFKEME